MWKETTLGGFQNINIHTCFSSSSLFLFPFVLFEVRLCMVEAHCGKLRICMVEAHLGIRDLFRVSLFSFFYGQVSVV